MPQFRRALPLLVALALLAIAAPAFAQDPPPETVPTEPVPPPPVVAAPNSTVAGVDISGLDQATAVQRVREAYAKWIVIRVGKQEHRISNRQLEATFAIDEAVAEALTRPNGGNTPVTTTYRKAAVTEAAERIHGLVSKPGRESQWVVKRRPALTKPRAGLTVSKVRIERQIEQALLQPLLRPEQETLPLVKVETTTTLAELGYVITISKGERILRLWAPVKGKARVVRSYRIAVGAPAFPTPSGRFTIVTMQKNPWWYPPDSDWARGEEPVPPGPSNPLGTRWMGLDRLSIGIHGTPDSGSIGGYASHGCVRMLIRQAEALFAKVSVGTPVQIY